MDNMDKVMELVELGLDKKIADVLNEIDDPSLAVACVGSALDIYRETHDVTGSDVADMVLSLAIGMKAFSEYEKEGAECINVM